MNSEETTEKLQNMLYRKLSHPKTIADDLQLPLIDIKNKIQELEKLAEDKKPLENSELIPGEESKQQTMAKYKRPYSYMWASLKWKKTGEELDGQPKGEVEKGNTGYEKSELLLAGGCSCQHKQPTKNILIMGQESSGENSFITFYVNYVLGVDMQDCFRYQVILPDYEQNHKEDVIVYHIKSTDIKRGSRTHCINLIKTGGYGGK